MTVAIGQTGVSSLLGFALAMLPRLDARSTTEPECDDDAELRNRRAFVLEMMQASPEAFQHEWDVMGAMRGVRGHF